MKKNNDIHRLWHMVTRYKSFLLLTFLTMIGTALTEVALPKCLGYLLDHGFKASQSFPLWYVPLFLVGIFLFRGICTFITSYLISRIGVNLLHELRSQIFQKVLLVPVSYFSEESGGKIINTIMFEAQQIVDMIKSSITTLFRDSLTVLALMIFLIWSNWQLTLVTLILIPGMTYLVRKVSQRLRRLNAEQLIVNGDLTQLIEETRRAHQVIRIFGGKDYESQRFDEKNRKLGGYTIKSTVAVSFTTPLTQLLASVALSVVIILAMMQAQKDASTVGHFVEFITALLLLLTPLKRLADLNGPIQRGLAATESVFQMIDTHIEEQKGKVLSSRCKGDLEFQHISFTYDAQESPTLENISFSVKAGETIALVGTSGSGKTTLVNLVPRFYTPQLGHIWLDGENMSDLSLESLRSQIAMVSQNVVLFDDTIAANVSYGDAHPDIHRIQSAIRAANLDSFINELPEGLQTMIGDNGSRLSGGQRQRLAIARAIYKDAPILILDEATSALDNEAERLVQSALDELMKNRTTLVIAHRLSTVERADRILVLNEGKIVESGTHQALLNQAGLYAHLYHLQFNRTLDAVS